jgi:toxin-antitoxin system PIN domain toxin
MLGIDTNILAYARLARSPWHGKAKSFLEEVADDTQVVISEQVLVELYLLLRNEKIISPPLSAEAAVRECSLFRSHPRWQLVDSAGVMDQVWPLASARNFPRRKIFDVRLAKSLQSHGVTRLATANVKDFENLGFERVWNPLI